MARRALILGAGGLTGIAWELGILAGLADVGVDLRQADLMVGTSAGSVVGAMLTSEVGVQEFYARQFAPPGTAPADRIGLGTVLRWGWALARSRDPQRARARVGRMALATRTVPEAERREVIESGLPTHHWPLQPLLVTAVDAESGEFVAFGRDSRVGSQPVTLVDAVAASCAVPGVWPPITIGGRHWIDGGVRSATNADLAAGYDRVVVLAPITRGPGPGSAAAQVAALRAGQAQVVLLAPDIQARRAIGRDVLNPARRAVAAYAGRAQARAVAGEVAELWSR